MKPSSLLGFIAFCGGALAAEPVPIVRCEVDASVERLDRTELEALRKKDRAFSPLVTELLDQSGPPTAPPELPDTDKAKEIDWEQAKRMVWNAIVTTTIQGHDLSVVLVTKSGRVYRTKEPKIDEIYRVAALIDPCHRYITHITE
jgi:hypothetical protein